MSRIEIERKRSRPWWPWVVALILVAVAAWGLWMYFGGEVPSLADEDVPAQTSPPAAETTPPDTL